MADLICKITLLYPNTLMTVEEHIMDNPITYEIGKATATDGRPRRSYLVAHGKELPTTPHPTVKTLYDIILYGARTNPAGKQVLGKRTLLRVIEETKLVDGVPKKWSYPELSPYSWVSFLDLLDSVKKIGSGLIHLGLREKDLLTIFHSTSPEWITMAHACYSQNMTITTAYDNLGDDALAFSLNEGDVTTIFTQVDLLHTIKKIHLKAVSLKNVIFSGSITPADFDDIKQACPNFTFYTMAEIEEYGRLHPSPANPPTPEDICCIMYTSGSTGNPKGVVMTHANIVAAVAGTLPAFNEVFSKDQHQGFFLAYLPLAHVLEFICEHTMMFYGFQLGYGNPRTLTDVSVRNCHGDIRELRPTFMAGVPTVWETIKKGVQSQLSNATPAQQYVFEKAFNFKKMLMRMGLPYHFMDSTVFKKIQDGTGGRLKLALTGGAPISPDTQEFMNVTLCTMLQGYGMTETCGAISLQPLSEKAVYGRVGAPFPCTEVKLVAFGEYNPNPTNPSQRPSGEVWARGANIMKGYFKQDALTAETITADGWLMTGDIGEWQEAIIDRKKNLVKLAHGEYVALEKLEARYKSSKYVLNMVIHADPLKSHIIGICTANEVEVKRLFAQCGTQDFTSQQVKSALGKEFLDCATAAGFKGAEVLKKFYFSHDLWTPENNLLTAAQKLNRKLILQKYDVQVEMLYK